MKTLILLILLTVITSCRNPDGYPRISDQEQLSPNFHYVEIDGKGYIDVEKSHCLSRIYRYSKGYIGPIGLAIEIPIQECQKVIGKAPREYAVFATWLEDFRIWLINM